jgi:hypothetical protein
LRFTGFDPYPSFDSLPRQVEAASSVCGWESFQGEGRYFLASASGCLDLPEYLLETADVCEKELQAYAPCDKARQLISTAAGSWDFSSSSNLGSMRIHQLSGESDITCSADSCTFSRPRRRDADCHEFYPLSIRRATIRDSSKKLGAAVLTGPECKNALTRDWDRLEQETPSISTFLMNNGLVEALQFDGVLNDGLVVTDNIANLAENLPRNSISVEIWFAVTSFDISFGGLVSLLQESDTCSRGWRLGYEHIEGNLFTLQFTIAVQGNLANDAKFVKSTAQVSFEIGTWMHLVATYNGDNVTIHLDSRLMDSSRACSRPPCGDILYPISADFEQCSAATKFNIGTYHNTATGQVYPFFGSIKSVRIFDRSLQSSEINGLFDIYARELKSSPITPTEYWVKQIAYPDYET